MSLFEWLFEAKNPHPVGEIKQRETPEPKDPIDWIFLIIGQSGFWACFYFIIESNRRGLGDKRIEWFIIVFGLFLCYLLLSYLLDIEPDYDNVGLLGGIIDHPFRYTDDANRFLIFLKIIFFPGFIMAQSMVELWKCCKRLFFV
jgi:hypothetical protein